MSVARIFSVGLLLATLASASCGTNAKGVEDCRSIELERCSASASCGFISDVDACQRYYRDQCLHGLPVGPPGAHVIAACVEAIRAAGTCAASVDGVDCQAPFTPDNACRAVQSPETLSACAFLDPGGTQGEGGSGNGTGGTGSEGGAPDSSGGTAGATTTGGASSDESGGTGASADAG